MNITESLNHFLPKIEIITPKNEVDYFGFSYYLSKELNYKSYNYSFSSWVHGWIFNELRDIIQFNTSQYSPKYKIVANQEQKLFLNKKGYSNVLVGGYPYVYIKNENKINRFKNSILIIPPKDSHNVNHKWNEEEYIDTILYLKKEFENIFFCIHQECLKKKKWINNLKKNNIDYVIGANTFDANSLIRTKIIFQHFEYVHSPTIGSSIVYAALDGCKVSLSDNYLEYKIEGYKNHPLYKSHKKYLEFEVFSKSKEYIKKKYGFLFNDPKKSSQLINWAKYELGSDNILPIKSLEKILGWRIVDKLINYPKKYFFGLKRRLKI